MQTAESILFGAGGVNAPVYARVAREIGRSRSTVSRWAKDASNIPFSDLQKIVRCRGLSDRLILDLMKGAIQ